MVNIYVEEYVKYSEDFFGILSMTLCIFPIIFFALMYIFLIKMLKKQILKIGFFKKLKFIKVIFKLSDHFEKLQINIYISILIVCLVFDFVAYSGLLSLIIKYLKNR